MVNDLRADHSLRVPRPDLSVDLGTPNACNQCHSDKTAEWAAEVVAAKYPDSSHRGIHFGEILHAARNAEADAGTRLIALAADSSQPGIARATAVALLGDLGESQHLLTIRRLLEDGDPLVRMAAVRVLENADVSTRVDQGWLLLDDPVRIVRIEASRVLAPLLRQPLPEKFREPLSRGVDEYIRTLRTNEDRAEAHLSLGLVGLAAGNAEYAEQAYQTALRIDPGFSPAYVNLADLYRQLGRDADGERLLRSGIDVVPTNADLRHALGLLLVREKRTAEALEELRLAARQNTENVHYAYVYALALHSYGKPGQAIAVLEDAQRQYPGNRPILNALVEFSRDRGDSEQARIYADKLRALAP